MPDGVTVEPLNGDDVGDKYDGIENKTSAQQQQQGKFNSYRRPRRLKRNWPQFRSLRSGGGTSKKCGKTTTSRSAAVAPSSDAQVDQPVADKYPKVMPKPIPAPRKVIGFSFNKPSAKHIYQNVPIPITPNTVTKSVANVVAVINNENAVTKKQQVGTEGKIPLAFVFVVTY